MNFVIYTRYIKEKSIIPPLHPSFFSRYIPSFTSLAPSSFVTRHSSFFPLFRHYIPPLKVASDSWVCTPQEIFITFPSSFVSRHSSFFPFFRHYIPPSPWEKSPNRRVCERGEDSLSFASKPRF